ncbi:MAG: hypothetical protein LKG27_03315 [Clostridiaceae bacterium]|jgi:hypothetical protein|nr:hypothetical protein [Clostridiaceae bacterium]
MTDIKKEIPFCPLMSVGAGLDMVCTKERCAWYVSSVKKCSVYMIAYNALLDANSKQKHS